MQAYVEGGVRYMVSRNGSIGVASRHVKRARLSSRRVGSDTESHGEDGEGLDVATLRSLLLEWYERDHRDLPWRAKPYAKMGEQVRESDAGAPYAVWVSEIMLQQTRVATVMDYFNRWMKEFPTVESLAKADRERVNEMWAGLGYYRRAKMLHEGANTVVKLHGGVLPSTVPELLKINGIGPYTAAAISSIAFGQPEAVVDGNVARVISRLESLEKQPNDPIFWGRARALLDPEHPGEFNQAMMELGATVCTPRSPSCSSCPLKSVCKSRNTAVQQGLDLEDYVGKFPQKAAKTKQREEVVAVALVENSNRLFMVKRPEDGLLGGLWEFPNSLIEQPAVTKGEEDDSKLLIKKLKKVMRKDARVLSDLDFEYVGEIQHIFSHIRQKLRIYYARVSGDDKVDTPGRDAVADEGTQWIAKERIENTAISTQMRKVLRKSESKKSTGKAKRENSSATTKRSKLPRHCKQNGGNTIDTYFLSPEGEEAQDDSS